MSKCPFWSTNKEKVGCYNACPMHSVSNESEPCPFKEFLSSNNKVTFVDNMDEDLFYSQDRYLNYDMNEKVINY
ncbi:MULTISPECIES: hypothetical protein [Clostridium]|uniref:hypothetical protein n=1 Tax=Clostridium TaxID=1485 RepID=UPI002AC70DB0|nr:hypothetical protein [Clostridium perfringens]MDZ4907393.1 hypothetical protein [Clostridium perfringens]MDZ4941434.1 hypothetical protein [Clostridium perfringens]